MVPDQRALMYAVALIALPILAGSVAGLLIGHRTTFRNRVVSRGLLAAVLVTSLFMVPTALSEVGVWDIAFSALLVVGALIVFWAAPSLRVGCANLLLATSAVGVGLLILEGSLSGVEGAVPRPPEPITGVRSVRASLLQPVCEAIYEPRAFLAGRLPGQGERGRPSVLHLGDSMVYGTGAGGPAFAFPAWLSKWDQRRTHQNLGFRGSATDAQWLALRNLLQFVEPEVVVHYVFLGNDFQETDSPSLCCEMRGLVLYEEPLRPRCEVASYEIPWRERLELSPAPYAIRAFAHRSVLAAQLVNGFARLGAAIARSGAAGERYDTLSGLGEPSFDRFARLERGIRTLAESAGAKFVVVLLPSRQIVTAALGRQPLAVDMWHGAGMEARRKVLEILRDGGYDTLDAFDFFESLVTDGDAGKWFARDLPGDFHLSALGHERMARWLWPQIER